MNLQRNFTQQVVFYGPGGSLMLCANHLEEMLNPEERAKFIEMFLKKRGMDLAAQPLLVRYINDAIEAYQASAK